MDERPEVITVNLSGISSGPELHATLAHALNFPDIYGQNWAAFWDAITGMVPMPRRLCLLGWSPFADRLPEQARQLRRCLDDMGREFPESASTVEYA